MSLPVRVVVAVAVFALLAVGLANGHSAKVACVVVPAVWAAMLAWYFIDRPKVLRRQRLANGLCGKCGYDLRGNLSGVCPKCGEVAL